MDVSNNYPSFVWIERDCSKGKYDYLSSGRNDASILPAVTVAVAMQGAPSASEGGENFECCSCVEGFQSTGRRRERVG